MLQCLDSLVPKDHLLRKIDAHIDFSFIYEKVAYRWFFDLRLTDKVFEASSFCQNRRRRFVGTPVYQEIFDEIVTQALTAGLVDAHVLYTDSTYLKAKANKQKFNQELAIKSQADYLDALDIAIDEDRAIHGKKPLKNAQCKKFNC